MKLLKFVMCAAATLLLLVAAADTHLAFVAR
jgi:hypothetical protein